MPNLSHLDDLAQAIAQEYAMRKGEIDGEKVRTLYFGGGTPSILPADTLSAIVEKLPCGDLEEFTIEANPEDISLGKAQDWMRMGVNRVSMGVQSLVDAELQAISRRHSAAQAIEAVETLRSTGIGNISLDLIYGLPGQTLQSWQASLDRLLALRPQHLSAYILSYEHGTRLTAMLRKGEITETPEETIAAMYHALCATAARYGYEHYEISNFALPGYQSKHNSSYWNDTPYLGLGPSAHSYDGQLRRINAANLKKYMQAICSGMPAYEIDEETADNRHNDYVMTRLRTACGIDIEQVSPQYRAALLQSAAPHIKRGTLAYDHGRLYIPESQWLLSNSTISDLMVVD